MGFPHINIDQLKFDKGYKDVGDDDVPDKVWEEIFEEADKLIVEYFNTGKSVANEYAWITSGWRDRARKVAKNAGFETKVIYIKLPQDVIKRRWLENSKTKTRFHWPEKELEKYLEEFEEPTQDENIILYDQSTDVDNWIEENLK